MHNGYGIAALITGLLAVVMIGIPWLLLLANITSAATLPLSLFSTVPALLAVLLGAVGVHHANRRQATNSGAATTGMVLGVLALVLLLVQLVVVFSV